MKLSFERDMERVAWHRRGGTRGVKPVASHLVARSKRERNCPFKHMYDGSSKCGRVKPRLFAYRLV